MTGSSCGLLPPQPAPEKQIATAKTRITICSHQARAAIFARLGCKYLILSCRSNRGRSPNKLKMSGFGESW